MPSRRHAQRQPRCSASQRRVPTRTCRHTPAPLAQATCLEDEVESRVLGQAVDQDKGRQQAVNGYPAGDVKAVGGQVGGHQRRGGVAPVPTAATREGVLVTAATGVLLKRTTSELGAQLQSHGGPPLPSPCPPHQYPAAARLE